MDASPERMSVFWSHRETAPHAECSHFYPRAMMVEGVRFTCCEQWMHWRKALLFGDTVAAAAILRARSGRPEGVGTTGRRVLG